LRALIYDRVSNDPDGRGLSVADQDSENRAFCARQGYDVVGSIVDNDRSASRRSKQARPGYAEVRERLAAGGVDVLVCWESSRAQRDLKAYVQVRELCEQHGVLFAYKGRTYDLSRPDDRFSTGLDALLDERYADEVHERVMRGVRSRVAAGRPHGKIPFGYKREYDPTSGAPLRQLVDEDTAPIVREMVARVLAGEGLYTICRDFNERGVITPQGHRDERRHVVRDDPRGWTPGKLRAQVKNPAIAGIRVANKEKVGPGDWPGIISVVEHQQVTALLADPTRRMQRGTEPKHLLSGIAECGVCGARCRRTVNRGKPNYICHGVNYDNRACVARRQEPLDAFVRQVVVAWLDRPDALAAFQPADDDGVADAGRELAEAQATLAEFEEAAAAGSVSAASFARIEQGLLERIEAARRRAVPMVVPRVVADLVGHAEETWPDLPLRVRRLAITTVCRVIIHKPVRPRGAAPFDPSTVEIRWRLG
jgi:DNA invertase Pin-like site-specific DNA recombinase